MRVGVMDGMSGPIIILNLKANFTKTAVPSLPLSLLIINLRVISWTFSFDRTNTNYSSFPNGVVKDSQIADTALPANQLSNFRWSQ